MELTILFSSFIALQLSLFCIYKYITLRHLEPNQNTTIVYINSSLPLAPATLYTFCLVNYLSGSCPNTLIELYIIEWTITTPLLLVSMMSMKRIHPLFYTFITVLCVAMNIAGYISFHLFTRGLSTHGSFLAFSIGIGTYIAIVASLTILYRTSESVLEAQEQYSVLNRHKVYTTLMVTTFITWSVYPILGYLYIVNSLNIDTLLIGFSCLDFISKGISTFFIVGYELHKQNKVSFVTQVTRRIARIEPITVVPTNGATAGTAVWTLTNVPTNTSEVQTEVLIA